MWKISDIANGGKTCDNFDMEEEQIPNVLKLIEREFHLNYSNGAVSEGFAGLDFSIEGKRVTIGWDNWSGVFIMSHGPEGNSVIERIEKILNQD